MNQFTKVLVVGVLFVVGVGLAFTFISGTQDAPLASPVPAAAQQKSAQDVYLDKCAVCHAQDGSGNTAKGKKVKAKDLRSAEVQKMSDVDMTNAIANGKGKDMDGYKDELGMPMIKQLEVYVRGFVKK